MSNYD